MYLEIRYYKRFDLDLIALIQNGVDLTSQLPAIIKAYAHGETYHFYVPSSFCKTVDLNEQKQIHNDDCGDYDIKNTRIVHNKNNSYRSIFYPFPVHISHSDLLSFVHHLTF